MVRLGNPVTHYSLQETPLRKSTSKRAAYQHQSEGRTKEKPKREEETPIISNRTKQARVQRNPILKPTHYQHLS